MGRKLFCDRCHFEIEETDTEKGEFTDIKLAKLISPAVPFQHVEVCKTCTSSLRHWIDAPQQEAV